MVCPFLEGMHFNIQHFCSGQSYRSLDRVKDTWQDAEWVAAFSDDVMLLKRPIFVKDGIAISVGFRNVMEIEERLRVT